MELTTEYKGFKIGYSERTDSWQAINEDIEFNSKEGLASLKKKIDVHMKKESKFRGMTAIDKGRYCRDGSDFRQITITSVTDDGEAWIKNGRGDREKLSAYSNIYIDNKHNKDIVAVIDSKAGEVKKIREEIVELEKTMEILFIPKIKD